MAVHSCHTIFAESFFTRNAGLFEPYLSFVGLGDAVLNSPESEIPLSQYVALWEILGQEVSPTIGLQVGISTHSHELGAYGHAVRSAPSMQMVLRCLSRFIAVLTQGTRVDIDEDAKTVALAYQITDPAIVRRRQDAEFSIGIALSLFREVTQNPTLTPIRVDFEHDAPADLSFHRQVFNCPIFFNRPDNRVCFSRDILDMPVGTADTRLFQALEPFLEQQRETRAAATDLLSQMGRHIASGLGSGNVSIEQVAASMRLGVRTLQRRLSVQGLDFSQMVEGVRRSLAENYVAQSDYSFTEIALLLGYSEASSFSRAFRRWHQLTPLQYRQRAKA
ncbi:MAG: AraC family transcriptional regulator [Pseudomonadaceae bacterium]|nr:AraC family transcriptional regulator [Pseudomonadaceae bacterium]